MRTRTFEELSLDSPEGSARCGNGKVPRGGAPPPKPRPHVSLEQLQSTQNDLMRRLIENDEHRGAEHRQPRHQERDSLYSNILATHSPVFADVTDTLEVDSWLCTTESMFGLLHCTEYQKTLYAAQQLEHCGLPTLPPYMMITMLHGMNFVLSSMHISYVRVYSAAS
jgi:hypothetical protein